MNWISGATILLLPTFDDLMANIYKEPFTISGKQISVLGRNVHGTKQYQGSKRLAVT